MANEQVSTELLRGFSPLDGLKRDNLAALARKVQIRELSPGQLLFKEGDTEKKAQSEIAEIERLLKAHQFQAAEDRAKAARELVAATSHAEKLRALTRDIEEKRKVERAAGEAAKRESRLQAAKDEIAAIQALVTEKRFAEARTKLEGAKPMILVPRFMSSQ